MDFNIGVRVNEEGEIAWDACTLPTSRGDIKPNPYIGFSFSSLIAIPIVKYIFNFLRNKPGAIGYN